MQMPSLELVLGVIFILMVVFFIVMLRLGRPRLRESQEVISYIDSMPPKDVRPMLNALTAEFERDVTTMPLKMAQHFLTILSALKDRVDSMEGRISGPDNRKAIIKEISRAVMHHAHMKKKENLSLGFLKQNIAAPTAEDSARLHRHFAAMIAIL